MRSEHVAKCGVPVITKVTAMLFLTCIWTPALGAQIGAAFRTIDPPQSVFTLAFDINDHHKIVGTYYDADGLGHGFLRTEDGRFVTIDDPRAKTVHSYLLRKGVASLIDFPSATATLAWGMNNRRQVVGWYQKKDGVVHGFIWQGGKFTSVDIPGATETVVLGINSVGDIVGIYVDTT